MADHYGKLTPAEKAYWDAYTRLRELSDWSGFTDGQISRKEATRNWLVNQRKSIWRAAQDSGWDKHDRQARYDQLKDESLNAGSCRRVAQLPTNGGTPFEKVMISEREMWWQTDSVDDETKKYKVANVDSLVLRRKQVYSLAEEEGWDESDRKLRYNNLCIATKTGDAYRQWQKTHDDTTGETEQTPGRPEQGSRAKAVGRARSFLGVTENPSGSNKGSPQPSGWQKRVIGSDGYAWCACFTACMAWDAGVVGGSSAGVVVCMDMAQKGKGMFRGYTTDPSRVHRGDFVIIGCKSCHIELVEETPGNNTTIKTIGGNTSPGSGGSQYNGGGVFRRNRARHEWIGFCLVDYPD